MNNYIRSIYLLCFFKNFARNSKVVVFIFAALMVQVRICEGEFVGDSDKNAINVRSYGDYKVVPEIRDNCDLQVMRAYGLYGDARSLSEPNEIFPSIKQNCCGPIDQHNIKAMWRSASNKIKKFQKFFLFTVKGMLSISQDFLRISIHANLIYKKIKDKKLPLETIRKDYPGVSYENGEIVWHKHNYKVLINSEFIGLTKGIELGMDAHKLKIIYHNLNQAAEFMTNLRRTFYGMICSVEGQVASNRQGMLKKIFYPDDIYFNTPFCESLIHNHFIYFYDYYYFVKRLQKFVDHLPYFMQETTEFNPETQSILKGGSPAPTNNSSGSKEDFIRKGVVIPYGKFRYYSPIYSKFKDNYDIGEPNIFDSLSIQACNMMPGFSTCEFYCQELSIVKNTERFDGRPDLMFKSFQVMLAIRERFGGFGENELEVDLVSLEKMAEELYYKVEEFVYKSMTPDSLEMSTKGADFSALVGFNPMELSEGCTLDFHFKSVGNLLISALTGIILLFLI
jgi:hypothetical protein